MKVMLVAKGRHLDSVGRTIADTCFLFGRHISYEGDKAYTCVLTDYLYARTLVTTAQTLPFIHNKGLPR